MEQEKDQGMATETDYKGIDANSDLPNTSTIPEPHTQFKKKDKYVYDCSCGEICGYVTAVVIFLLTLVFGIVFIVLTAVGKENTSSSEKDCDCTQFTPSIGYGLGASLLLEVGMLVVLIVFVAVISLTKKNDTEKIFLAFSIFLCALITLNFLGFLCATIAAIVFVGTGGSGCCSVTSIIVASLSVVLATIKLLIITVVCCWSMKDCDCDTTTRTETYLVQRIY